MTLVHFDGGRLVFIQTPFAILKSLPKPTYANSPDSNRAKAVFGWQVMI